MNWPINSYSKKLIIILQVGLPFLLISFSLLCVQPLQAQTAGAVSGLVFEDLNFNNNLDLYETKLADWRVSLYQKEKLIKTQLTNSAGEYDFTNLVPDDYQVKVEVPNSWAAINGSSSFVSLSAEEKAIINFANYQVIREERGMGPMMNISNYSIETISPTAVKVTWFTNYLATSQIVFDQTSILGLKLIAYDINFGYASSTPLDFGLKTYHTLTLTNLEPETTYYFRIIALADPKQWRGAPRIFSSELSFTTTSLTDGTGGPMAGDEFEGKISSISSPEWKTGTTGKVAAGELGELQEELQNKPLNETTSTDQLSFLSKNCLIYIWLLLVLNLLMIIAIWSRGKRTKNPLAKNLWWITLILVLGPTILGYPQCWLTVWLIFTLVIALVLFSGFKKKSSPPLSGDDDQSTEPFPLD
ncbi:MAG: SdrD B-like domain-containing protein [Patescibacteria group bacterium]|jgi:hypothetical protein